MNKKIFQAFIKSIGGFALYSGKDSTMYIHNVEDETPLIKHYGRHFMFPFSIQFQNKIKSPSW
jgi:hypothetical protein